jgi:putative sterol carrier protein
VRYLSAEWIAAVAGAVEADRDLQALASDIELTVLQVIDDVGYHLAITGGRVAIEPGMVDDADIVIRQDRPTAVAIARGEMNAQQAFISGRLRIAGGVAALLGIQPVFASIDRALAPVHARTEYE